MSGASHKWPNFFIVGAAKSGTSALVDFLGQHPDIFFSPIKEPQYFISNNTFGSLDDYLKLFRSVKGESIVGEGSTGYLYDQSSPLLINKFNSSAKILISLRNPIDMAYSMWKYMRIHGNEKFLFEDAVADIENRHVDSFRNACAGWAENYFYIERAKYYSQVKRYVKTFGADSVKIIFFEEFITDPVEACADVFKFLEVSPNFKIRSSVVNPGGVVRFHWLKKISNKKHPILRKLFPVKVRNKVRLFVRDLNVNTTRNDIMMCPETRDFLREEFKLDVRLLKQLLDKDISFWEDFA